MKSSIKHDSFDRFGNHVPWLTYPFMAFIKNRIHYEMRIFEFGSGASTIWFSQSVKNLVSVENNPTWYFKTKPVLNKNVIYILSELGTNQGYLASCFLPLGKPSNYAKEIRVFEENFDVVLIDGVDRLNCIACSIEKLTEDGIIVVDNLEFEKHMEDALILLKTNGFKRLDFWGISPSVYYETCTSVFYRENNCLGI